MARITDNRHVFHWNGETVTVTRRMVGKGAALRVRVTVARSVSGEVTRDEFRDYRGSDFQNGQAAFGRHVDTFARLIDRAARKA